MANSIKLKRSAVAGKVPATSDFTVGELAANTSDGRLFLRCNNGTDYVREFAFLDSAGALASGPASFMGNVAIGSAISSIISLKVAANITGGATANGVYSQGVVQSDVVTAARGFITQFNTAASAFTLAAYAHYLASQGTIGAGSTVTTQYGFQAASNLTGATNNYGFFSGISAGTGRWNFYANGTAANYFAGKVGVGSNALPSMLGVSGTASAPDLTAAAGGIFGVDNTQTRLVFSIDINTPFAASIQHKHVSLDNYSYPILLNPLGGNVGIGISVPTEKLHVSGNAIVSGTVLVGGNLGVTNGALVRSTGTVGQVTVQPTAAEPMGIQYKNPAASGFYNWFAGAGVAPGNNYFSIIPSTTVDGAVFSGPVFYVSQAGDATVSRNFTAGGGHIQSVSSTGDALVSISRGNNANDAFTRYIPAGALSGANRQYMTGLLPGTNNYGVQAYDGTTRTSLLTLDSGGNLTLGGGATLAGSLMMSGGSVLINQFATNIGMDFRRANGTSTAPTAISSGQTIAIIGFIGRNASNWNTLRSAWIAGIPTEAHTTSAQGAKLEFGTIKNGTITQAVRLLIDGTGLLTLGAAGETGNHTVNGGLVIAHSSSSVLNLQSGSSIMYGNAAAGIFTLYAGPTAGTDPKFQLFSGTHATNAGQAYLDSNTFALRTLAGVEKFSVNAAGLVTLGTSGGTQTHVVNGNMSITGSFIGKLAPRASVTLPALNIDANSGDVFYKAVAAATTFTMSNLADGQTIVMIVENTAASDVALTWPTGMKWPGGTVVSTVKALKQNVYTFVKRSTITYVTAVEEMA